MSHGRPQPLRSRGIVAQPNAHNHKHGTVACKMLSTILMNDTHCSRPIITAPTFADTAVTSPKGKARADARKANRLAAKAGKSTLGDRVLVWSVACEGGLVDIAILAVRDDAGEITLTTAEYYAYVRLLARHLQPDCTMPAVLAD